MRTFIFLLIVFPSFAFAFCETYTKFGNPVKVCWNQTHKAFLSERCAESCDAINFLLKKNPKPSRIDRSGGRNPATQYCKAYELNIYVLKDPRGAEQSFCGFPDGSLVDANGLTRSLK